MQKRGRAEKRRLEFDGQDIAGLNKCGKLASEKGELEVGENGRIYVIADGQIKWPAIEAEHLDQPGVGPNNARDFFNEWYFDNLLKDVTYIRLDGHGSEIQRILLRDTELVTLDQGKDFDAVGVAIATIIYKMAFYEPVFL